MKGIKKLVIFFLFGIMLTFSVRAPLCESIDPTDSEVIIKTSANNQYVIHNYTQAVVSEAEQQPFVVNKRTIFLRNANAISFSIVQGKGRAHFLSRGREV